MPTGAAHADERLVVASTSPLPAIEPDSEAYWGACRDGRLEIVLTTFDLDEYVVWDREAEIRFKKPGRETLYARCTITDEEVAAIEAELAQLPDEEAEAFRASYQDVADEVELEDVYATERQLLYVAATRARDRLYVCAVQPGSEFLGDMAAT